MRLSDDSIDLTKGDELHQRAGQKDDAGAAQHDQRNGDGIQGRGIDGPDFAVANRVDGGDDHVDGISEAPAGGHIGGGAEHHYRDRVDDAAGKIADRRVEQTGHPRFRHATDLARPSSCQMRGRHLGGPIVGSSCCG